MAHQEQPQSLPRRADLPLIDDLVVDDLRARTAIGIERYGTPLQPFNGRDALRDAYEEALDGAKYARQALYERDHIRRLAREALNTENADLRLSRLDALAAFIVKGS